MSFLFFKLRNNLDIIKSTNLICIVLLIFIDVFIPKQEMSYCIKQCAQISILSVEEW